MTSSEITSALKHHANSDIVLTLHAVVKVPRDVRERRSCTSDYWLIFWPRTAPDHGVLNSDFFQVLNRRSEHWGHSGTTTCLNLGVGLMEQCPRQPTGDLRITMDNHFVKVPWDARERCSYTSDYWQIAFLHLQVRKMHRNGRRNATGTVVYTTKWQHLVQNN